MTTRRWVRRPAAADGHSARIHTFAAAARDLLNSSKGPARVQNPGAEARFVKEALSALQGLYALFGSYLEHALQLLEPHISRDAVRASILETRRELDDLGARRTAGEVYVETLTVTEPEAKAVSLEVEGALGAVVP